MIYSIYLAVALASAAPVQSNLPACCSVVTETVYVNPKPAYPKDIRQYTRVAKTVRKVVCRAAQAACCPPVSR